MICAPAAERPVSEREHGPEDRERCEDGADDHRLTNDSRLGVCAGKQRGHSLRRRSRIKRLRFHYPATAAIGEKSPSVGMTNRQRPLLRDAQTSPTARFSCESADSYRCLPLYSTARIRPSLSWQMKSG